MAEPIVYRWELTDLQFKVLCEDRRIGGLPRPFTFTSTIKFADDLAVAKEEARAGLERLPDPEFDAMVRALTKPDIMVTANLWHEREYTDPRRCIRVHAVRRDERAYVITQRPGETVAHSGGFDIAECTPATLARTVLGLLPDMPAGSDPDALPERGGGGAPRAGGPHTTGTARASSVSRCGNAEGRGPPRPNTPPQKNVAPKHNPKPQQKIKQIKCTTPIRAHPPPRPPSPQRNK
ncbi:ESX secretion-associated protein EspG, partial [Nocardia carnea]|uniref:ESX secretion-associated protein EspG n=1 Tax=Nocardia carnea TaxID=37328 RepID=UPI0024540AD9